MSVRTSRAKFIRTVMLDAALQRGLEAAEQNGSEKGLDIFSSIYDFISHIDKGDGSIPNEVITPENRIPLDCYTEAVKRWQNDRDKIRSEYSKK